ncbi:MAG: adenylate kinase [Chloroflexi bacterium]|nr:adenylate kinase [Chloroflexota bacterium]
MYIILLGAPGAGKGTQAAIISDKINLEHVATGDLFRQALEQGTGLGNKARSFMDKGLLVPDEITIELVLGKLSSAEGGRFVLDGFPRNLKQAKALDEALAKQSRDIDKVVYIMVPEDVLLKRLAGRWICRSCQAPYHSVDSPPKVEGRCDRCGGELYQRPDDTVETARKRLEVYFAETAPLIDYYARTGKLVEIDGEGGVDEVSQRILVALSQESRAE